MQYREALLLYFMACKGRVFIHGHFPYSEAAHRQYGDDYAFITVLRDPVDRYISEYFYNRHHPQSERHKAVASLPLEAYLDSEFGRGQGCQYVRFFGSPATPEEYRSAECIGRATERLSRFDLVGCVEHGDRFVSDFEREFGRRLSLSRRNQSPAPTGERERVVTPAVLEKIRELCLPDEEIYRYAVALGGPVIKDRS